MVDEVVHLLTLYEQILEERYFPPNNRRDAALYISRDTQAARAPSSARPLCK
jgi:hypothetical protein